MLQKGLAAACLAAALACGAVAAEPPKPARGEILDYLDRIRLTEHGMMNVQPVEGEYLSGLVKQLNAKRVLEIGTSNGYSGSWIALALRETGGKLVTLEIDARRHALAVKNFKSTGLDGIVDARSCDALKEIPKIDGPFDLVFIDAWKPDYARYLELTLPKVRKGGIIVAHNVDSQASEMAEFLAAIKGNPRLETEFVRLTQSGFSVSRKR